MTATTYANTCAHEQGPVCEGKQQSALTADYRGPGKRVRERSAEEDPAIACPWHGWEHDPTTRDHLGDPEISLPVFDVVVKDGSVYVEH